MSPGALSCCGRVMLANMSENPRSRVMAWFHRTFGDDTPHTHDWSGVNRHGESYCVECRELRSHHILHDYQETKARQTTVSD